MGSVTGAQLSAVSPSNGTQFSPRRRELGQRQCRTLTASLPRRPRLNKCVQWHLAILQHNAPSLDRHSASHWRVPAIRSETGEPDANEDTDDVQLLSSPSVSSPFASGSSPFAPPPGFPFPSGAPGETPRAPPGFPQMDVPDAPEEVQLVMCLQTDHSSIAVLRFPDKPEAFGFGLAGSTILKLDSTNNVHSWYHPVDLWTDSYWDDLAAVTVLCPKGGSVGMMGLGAGTAARLIRKTRPDLHVEGWEIDSMVVEVGRDFFDLKACEQPSAEGGTLTVHIGDAFEAKSSNPKGFDCLIVDLFADGTILKRLSQPDTWRSLRAKLAPGGRMVVNCGGPSLEPALADTDECWQAVKATMCAALEAFLGEAYFHHSDELAADCNYMLLLGPPFDVERWISELPDEIGELPKKWLPLEEDSKCFVR